MARVVCFDVGGVLIRITQNWHEAARHAGVFIAATVPVGATLTDAPLFEEFQSGAVIDEQYIDALAEYLGCNDEDALKVHNHIMLEPFADVDWIVRELNRLGILTACLSNTNAPHWRDMFESGRFPANGSLKVRMASHEVGLQKPDPRIFAQFETEVGFCGLDIVLFDDSPLNVEVAASLGWRSFLIDPERATANQLISHLESLGIELDRLSNGA